MAEGSISIISFSQSIKETQFFLKELFSFLSLSLWLSLSLSLFVSLSLSLCHIHTHALSHSLQGSSFKEKQSHHPKKSSGSVGSFQQIRPRVFQLLLCFNLTLSLPLSLSPSPCPILPSISHTHTPTYTRTQSHSLQFP